MLWLTRNKRKGILPSMLARTLKMFNKIIPSRTSNLRAKTTGTRTVTMQATMKRQVGQRVTRHVHRQKDLGASRKIMTSSITPVIDHSSAELDKIWKQNYFCHITFCYLIVYLFLGQVLPSAYYFLTNENQKFPKFKSNDATRSGLESVYLSLPCFPRASVASESDVCVQEHHPHTA